VVSATEEVRLGDSLVRASTAVRPPTPDHQRSVQPSRPFEAMRAVDAAALERLDRITGLATQVFGVHGAAINLLDQSNQYSRATVTWMPEVLPREQSVCAVTVEQPGVLVVPDLTADIRFADNELVAASGMRFYAGVPLLGSGGEPVGAFCIFDSEPRELDERERRMLVEIAGWAQDELEVNADRAGGFQVQQGLLPASLVSLDGYDIAGVSQPMRAVGGDFYDWYPVRGGAAFTFGDVMGKGVSAALIAATVRATMRASSRVNGPAAAVESAADTLDADLDGAGVFVTLFHGHLLETTGAITYIDAGHGLSLVVREDGDVERIETTGLPLGAGWDNTWEERSVSLRPGDVFVLVSDGVLDAFGGALDALDHVEAIVRASRDARDICDRVAAAAVPGAPDDVTVIALRRQDVPRIGG